MDNKIINFNPIFVFSNFSSEFKPGSFIVLCLNVILLSFLIIILYIFFETELRFIYNFMTKKQKKNKKRKN